MKIFGPLSGLGGFISGLMIQALGQLNWSPGWIIVLVVALCFLIPIVCKSSIGIGNALQLVFEVKIPNFFGVSPAPTRETASAPKRNQKHPAQPDGAKRANPKRGVSGESAKGRSAASTRKL